MYSSVIVNRNDYKFVEDTFKQICKRHYYDNSRFKALNKDEVESNQHFIKCMFPEECKKEYTRAVATLNTNQEYAQHIMQEFNEKFDSIYINFLKSNYPLYFEDYEKYIKDIIDYRRKRTEELKEYFKVIEFEQMTFNNNEEELKEKQTYENLKQAIKTVMMSYNGNWVIDSFGKRRREKIINFIRHKFKSTFEEKIIKAYDELLDELAEIDIKPYGEI